MCDDAYVGVFAAATCIPLQTSQAALQKSHGNAIIVFSVTVIRPNFAGVYNRPEAEPPPERAKVNAVKHGSPASTLRAPHRKSPMTSFTTAIDSFINTIKRLQPSVDELNAHSRELATLYDQAGLRELTAALHRLASLMPDVPLVAKGHVSLACGALVERGGDPAIAGPILLDELPSVSDQATDFYHRCRRLAESDAGLVQQWRIDAIADGAESDELTPAAIVEDHLSNMGWDELAARFGPLLFQTHPESVHGYMAENFFRLGLIAHLSRSKPLRSAARAQSKFLEHTRRADQAAGCEQSFLSTMLQVLDDEPLLVMHVEQRKGYAMRMSGIADNFQLQTLLGGALIDPAVGGKLPGKAPTALAVAQCRDVEAGESGGEHVIGAFNLWNWGAMRADASLPDGLSGLEHWIWGEGCPADIARFEALRVILLGAPSYQQGWRAGRTFSGMAGELTIERQLSDDEVGAWLYRLSKAACL